MTTEIKTLDNVVSANIRAVMGYRNLNQGQLAKQAGVSPITIHNILNDVHTPNMSSITKIASVLEVSISDLYKTNLINIQK